MAKVTKPMVHEHNVSTDEIIVREMTDQEYEAYQQKLNGEEKAAAKAIARAALLDKLGITEEEAQLLLGGN